jgi:hypothetical protein
MTQTPLFTAAAAIVGFLLTVIGSFLAAWLATRLGLRRFYREKIWERKTDAYTVIFRALFDMARWHDEHLTAYFRERDVDAAEAAELRKDYK